VFPLPFPFSSSFAYCRLSSCSSCSSSSSSGIPSCTAKARGRCIRAGATGISEAEALLLLLLLLALLAAATTAAAAAIWPQEASKKGGLVLSRGAPQLSFVTLLELFRQEAKEVVALVTAEVALALAVAVFKGEEEEEQDKSVEE